VHDGVRDRSASKSIATKRVRRFLRRFVLAMEV
jgi:hypothetical protein